METIVIENPVVITDMKKKVRDIQMAISWRDFANTYFQRSSSWFYHKMTETVVSVASAKKKQSKCVVP